MLLIADICSARPLARFRNLHLLSFTLSGLNENIKQLIKNQLFDQGVRGILQITQRKQQSGSSALNNEG